MVSATKFAILDRLHGFTKPISVPFDVQKHIDDTIEENVDAAFKEFPRSFDEDVEDAHYWARLDFYKSKILEKLRPEHRPRAAAEFHEYVAACKRGSDLAVA